MGDIVDIALSQVGYTETGGNRTKYGKWYGMDGAAWCHMFVSWCADQAGAAGSVPKTADTTVGMNWFKNKGLFKYKGQYTPKRGDIVYFKTGRSHVGIVEKTSGSTLYTVEGNSGSVVKKRSYSLAEKTITGYGVPKYSGGSSTSVNKKADATKELDYLKKLQTAKQEEAKIIDAAAIGVETKPNATVKVVVHNGQDRFLAPSLEGLQISWERVGSPGRLTFKTPLDLSSRITEESRVFIIVDGKKMFKGYVFSCQHSKDGILSITAYDQLRYLKNKDSYFYQNKTASELIRQIAEDFKLKVGSIADTKTRITRNEMDATLLDIIQNALDETLMSTGKVYTLYDSYGRICLSEPSKMKRDGCVVDGDTVVDYSYKTDIDSNTYNKVKLGYENKETGTLETFVAQSPDTMKKWGVLQLFEKIGAPELGRLKSEVLLNLYNQKTRTLSVKEALGNTSVTAGCMVPVLLDLGDARVGSYMLVEKVVHKFGNNLHTMDLTLSGGGYSG